MNLDELAGYQRDSAISDLMSLAQECATRFNRALTLFGVDSRGHRGAMTMEQSVLILIPPWDRLCGRYRVVIHGEKSGQMRLLADLDSNSHELWKSFVRHELFPTLLRDDELIRNVMFAVRLLPCDSIARAVDSVEGYFTGFPFSNLLPPWVSEAHIEPWSWNQRR